MEEWTRERGARRLCAVLSLLLLLSEVGSSLNDKAGGSLSISDQAKLPPGNGAGGGEETHPGEKPGPPGQSPSDPDGRQAPPEGYEPPPPAGAAAAPPPPSPPPPPPPPPPPEESSNQTGTIIIVVAVAVSLVIIAALILSILYWKNKKSTIKPLGAALSGQLRKAFVEGVQCLKESDLRTACEEYCNVISEEGSDCSLLKGMLFSGVEIAVSRFNMDGTWTKSSQKQFKKRIEMLSKIHHKNFVCLIGYCEEDGEEPSRMMVFEYVSNGTLYEHLHVKEQEGDHLNWASRMRIAMGIAYCLEHLHQLDPPVILGNINSKSILLTDDFAAKIADLDLWSQTHELGSISPAPSDREDVVYRFGIILLELVTGKSHSTEVEFITWAFDYLGGAKPIDGLLDPTLSSFSADHVRSLCQVIESCLHLDPRMRPSMKDVVAQLRRIVPISPNAASPYPSPLWWSELDSSSSLKF